MRDRGIEFKPDADDPKRVTVARGLPSGLSRAEITFRIEGGIRGTRVVRRSEAGFAHLRTIGNGGYEGSWGAVTQLSLADAAHYLTQVQQRITLQENEIRRRREAVDLTCPWCDQQRTYIGVLGFLTGHSGLLTDHPSDWGQEVLKQHAYRCGRCGSMQFFADGYLAHPLPGRPADEQTSE